MNTLTKVLIFRVALIAFVILAARTTAVTGFPLPGTCLAPE